jgi:dsRNA-specific ribonuclease
LKDYGDYVFSLVGVIAKELGMKRTEKFLEKHFSQLDVEWKKVINIQRPDEKLTEIVKKMYGGEEPTTR